MPYLEYLLYQLRSIQFSSLILTCLSGSLGLNMRYGKKLALIAEATNSNSSDNSRFISHRELKGYLAQYSRLQKQGSPTSGNSMVQCLLRFECLIRDDLKLIREHIRIDAQNVRNEVQELRRSAEQIGVLGSAVATQLVAAIVQVQFIPPSVLSLLTCSYSTHLGQRISRRL